jgi:branched-chain amino acid transport system substrate-binding protein
MSELSIGKSLRLFLGLVSSAMLLFLLSCSGGEPVTIGFVGGMSGRVADLGINGRNGVLLAVEERNRNGGINGRPVRLLIKDDKQDKETAIQMVRSLLDQKVSAIIGHMTSSMAMATVDLVNDSQTIIMSPTATTDYLTGKDDSFMRVSTTTAVAAAKMADYLFEEAGIKAVSVIYDLSNKAYTESWLKSFRKKFEAVHGEILKVEPFTSGQGKSLLQTVENAYDERSRGLIIISSAMDAAMMCQQVRKIDWPVQIALSEWASTGNLVDLGGVTVEGALISLFSDNNCTLPSYVSFKSDFQKDFGVSPGFAAVNAYDAANVVMESLAARRKGESLKETVLRLATFQGVQGPITIDPYGDANRKAYIAKVSNATIMVLK